MAAQGLGYSEAADMKVGGRVRVGGEDREVLAVRSEGRCSPYFLLADCDVRVFGMDVPGAGWVSWMTCGKAGV
jgi:hypothetical protein